MLFIRKDGSAGANFSFARWPYAAGARCPGGYEIRPYAVGDDACIGSEGLRLPRVPGGQTQRSPSRLKKQANYPRMPLFLIACTASPIFSTGIVRAKRT